MDEGLHLDFPPSDFVAAFPLTQLKDDGLSYTAQDVGAFNRYGTIYPISDIIAAYNLKKGHQFVEYDPSNKVGEVVFAEGKVGVITATTKEIRVTIYCNISYSDGSTNENMNSGYLRFANYRGGLPGYSYPVESVCGPWS